MIIRHAYTIVVEEIPVTRCTGYVADQITITDEDARYLMYVKLSEPAVFGRVIEQLLTRFPSNRI